MTSTISEDALQQQQSRIMDAMRQSAQPTAQQVSPQDLLQATLEGNQPGGNYLGALKQAQVAQTQNNLASQTGIYSQMKEQVARGNTNAAEIDKAITDVAGDDPKIYASIAQDLHNDPEPVTPANAKQKVMKYAAEKGIVPLAQQQEQAKSSKAVGEANMANMFNPTSTIAPSTLPSNTQLAPDVNNTSSNAITTSNNITIAPKKLTDPDTSGKYNEQYLSTLQPALASQIRGIARGDLSLPTGRVLQTPYGQSLMNAVMTYDPTASEVNLGARKKTRDSFAAGKDSNELKSLDQLAGHIENLDEAGKALDNGSVPAWNYAANYIGQNFQNKAVLNPYKLSKSIAGDEISKLLTGSGGSLSDRKEIQDTLSPSASNEDRTATIEKAVKSVYDRAKALQDKYNEGMGITNAQGNIEKPIIPQVTLALFDKYGLDTNYFGAPNVPKANNLKQPKESFTTVPGSQASIQAQSEGKQPSGKIVDYSEYFK